MKKSFKEKVKKLYKSKLFMSLFFLTLVVGLVSAGWIITHNATSGYIISSESQIVFSDDFSVESVDVTSGSASKVEVMNITNTDGDFDLLLGIETTIDDVVDDCDPTGDVSVVTKLNDVEVYDEDVLTILSGLNEFTIQTDVVARACPGNFSSSVTLTPN